MNDFGLFQYFTTTSATTVKLYRRRDKNNDHIELNDTAPLPLLIGIGFTLFIGIVLLLLICCCCRKNRGPPASGPDQLVNKVQYQRAPVSDGMGFVGGTAYPMTSVSPTPFLTSSVNYPPPHMGHMVQHNYGVIDSDVKYSKSVQGPYIQQPPHFGGVPPFPPGQYIPTFPVPQPPQHTHSISHSSHTSSSLSGSASESLVPPIAPAGPQHHYLHHQQQHLQQFPPFMPPAAHQHLQQHFTSGRQSPALHYSQNPQLPALTSNYGVMPSSSHTIHTASSSLPATQDNHLLGGTAPYKNQPLDGQTTCNIYPPDTRQADINHPLEGHINYPLAGQINHLSEGQINHALDGQFNHALEGQINHPLEGQMVHINYPLDGQIALTKQPLEDQITNINCQLDGEISQCVVQSVNGMKDLVQSSDDIENVVKSSNYMKNAVQSSNYTRDAVQSLNDVQDMVQSSNSNYMKDAVQSSNCMKGMDQSSNYKDTVQSLSYTNDVVQSLNDATNMVQSLNNTKDLVQSSVAIGDMVQSTSYTDEQGVQRVPEEVHLK